MRSFESHSNSNESSTNGQQNDDPTSEDASLLVNNLEETPDAGLAVDLLFVAIGEWI